MVIKLIMGIGRRQEYCGFLSMHIKWLDIHSNSSHNKNSECIYLCLPRVLNVITSITKYSCILSNDDNVILNFIHWILAWGTRKHEQNNTGWIIYTFCSWCALIIYWCVRAKKVMHKYSEVVMLFSDVDRIMQALRTNETQKSGQRNVNIRKPMLTAYM